MCNQEGPQPERPFSITMFYLPDFYLEQIKLSQQFDAKLARIASTLKVFLCIWLSEKACRGCAVCLLS